MMYHRVPGMTKVHPNATLAISTSNPTALVGFSNNTSNKDDPRDREVVVTVWRKSLLLNCNGFTVFDCNGNLVFRVDNYVAGHRPEILLMDASGNPLLTIRRKRLSLGDNWQVFDGETTVNPRFTARKHTNRLNGKCIAQVSYGGSPGSGASSPSSPSSPSSSALSSWRTGGRSQQPLAYEIEGSYVQRSCAIYDDKRRLVAEIRRKESVGNDVFRLVVHSETIEASVAMALVILLDQMFGSSRRISS